MSDDLEMIRVPNISDFLEGNKVPISPAIRANGFLFISGAPPIDPETGELVRGDIATQTDVVMRHIGAILKASDSSFDKVVKVTIYCTNSAYFRIVNEVYMKYFGDHKPTRTFVTVASWPMEFDIEIECMAVA
ncbi:Rid family detoxifying hydrolase [Pseudodonghicola flavimaris]|uniref:Rid family detoxifying hydrolase n=1 Tax=Pseudodonghicola flavimaris TaxID=3050036 RepID=A0ABT7F2B8_9RHOB|nr:Rid family detoxifying hydrolase [Pseudodonghicola flavimaris]MDK3018757.1 Rid family detoxifying hydrolase [Pseudodonghicola flavimaris]